MREKRGMTQDISTHTLTWSVTSVYKSLWSAWIISTHTLTWSVTSDFGFPVTIKWFQLTRSRGAWRHKCIYPYWQIFKFQLTRSRGAWHSCKNTLSAFPISTHTLTWSVTLLVISLIGITGFQLTRSRGAWLKCFLILWISSAFQLTRSRGAWHARSGSISIKTAISTHTLTWSVTIDKVGRMIFVDNFNSHAHVERDSSAIPDRNIHWISTHTLTWSVTTEKQP